MLCCTLLHCIVLCCNCCVIVINVWCVLRCACICIRTRVRIWKDIVLCGVGVPWLALYLCLYHKCKRVFNCMLGVVLWYAVLCCAVMCCVVLCCAVLYCTVLYRSVLYSTIMYCTILHCTALYCTVPDCTGL